jgi:hypothetical protein
MSTEKKFIRRKGKCAWQDYKANDDILTEIKINPVVKKIQNYINRYRMIGEWTETITLNCDISTMWETKRGRNLKKPLDC